MNRGVAVNLAGGSLEYLAFQALRQPEEIDGSVHRRFRRLHGIVLVVDRRGWTRQVVDFVNLDIERESHVVPDELEARHAVQVLDVALGSREQVVDTQDLMPQGQQAVDQMRSEEAGSTRHQD